MNAHWYQMRKAYLDIGYSAEYIKNLDTKKYYIPHTRQRGYLFAVNLAKSDLPLKWLDAMKRLQRSSSSIFEQFLLPSDDPRIHEVRVKWLEEGGKDRKVDWEACEGRHLKMRIEGQLGSRRPMTMWEEG